MIPPFVNSSPPLSPYFWATFPSDTTDMRSGAVCGQFESRPVVRCMHSTPCECFELVRGLRKDSQQVAVNVTNAQSRVISPVCLYFWTCCHSRVILACAEKKNGLFTLVKRSYRWAASRDTSYMQILSKRITFHLAQAGHVTKRVLALTIVSCLH